MSNYKLTSQDLIMSENEVIQIKLEDVVNKIKESTDLFGKNAWLVYYADLDQLDITGNFANGDQVILSYSGLGEFTDSEGRFFDDPEYLKDEVAKEIGRGIKSRSFYRTFADIDLEIVE